MAETRPTPRITGTATGCGVPQRSVLGPSVDRRMARFGTRISPGFSPGWRVCTFGSMERRILIPWTGGWTYRLQATDEDAWRHFARLATVQLAGIPWSFGCPSTKRTYHLSSGRFGQQWRYFQWWAKGRSNHPLQLTRLLWPLFSV